MLKICWSENAGKTYVRARRAHTYWRQIWTITVVQNAKLSSLNNSRDVTVEIIVVLS
jgi:hypothetical protein